MSPKSLAQLSNDMKRNLFEKIRPLVQIMEKKKQQVDDEKINQLNKQIEGLEN